MHNLKKNFFFVSKMTRIWWILTWALEILKIPTLIGSFSAKYITLDLKKYWGVIFHDKEEWYKFEERLTFGLENNMSNMSDFHQNTWMSQDWDFDGILLFKVENVWA